jgi:hypothetical protein
MNMKEAENPNQKPSSSNASSTKGGGSSATGRSSPKSTRLRGVKQREIAGAVSDSWPDALEDIVQYCTQRLSNHLEGDFKDLESTAFVKSLRKARAIWGEKGKMPPELTIFSRLTGLVSYQVHNRKYVCVQYPSSNLAGWQEALHWLVREYAPGKVALENNPSISELFSILLDHLNGHASLDLGEGDKSLDEDNEEEELNIGEIHPARRSSIRDWQVRRESLITEEYEHEEEGESFYAYPMVEILVSNDAKHMVVIFVSPLDENFVDEKVDDSHRCTEITLALYDVDKLIYPGATDLLAPQLKQAFARVLFTSMHHQASKALMSSFNHQNVILRHWVAEASKGHNGLVDEQQLKAEFDPFRFCEAVVDKILCARMPSLTGVEVYPFDRVYIFKEAGSSTNQDQSQPVEMLVLEASILSNNPADRGRYLTRKERIIRKTQDFECDASQKIIADENTFRFYIHGGDKCLLLSTKATLSQTEKTEVESRSLSSARSNGDNQGANAKSYRISIPEDQEDSELSVILSNLFGRLMKDNYQNKTHTHPLSGDILAKSDTFSDEFEQNRLSVTEKFDPDGLLFRYAHGVNLGRDVPILSRLEARYSEFLDFHYRERNNQHLMEQYRQDNLNETDIETLLKAEKEKQENDKKSAQTGEEMEVYSKVKQTAKVVYISFSWDLHDANMSYLREKDDLETEEGGKGGTVGQRNDEAILGEEYTYTMLLVADQDPEKSIAQLNSERENLRLFLQLIMKRIWTDSVNERERLDKKSRIIQLSLNQFLHRAKAMVPKKKDKEFFDDQYKRLRQIIKPYGTSLANKEMETGEQVIATLLGLEKITGIEDTHQAVMLRAQQLLNNAKCPLEDLRLEIKDIGIPPLKVKWSQAVVTEAFNDSLKNGCEAAFVTANKENKPAVKLHLQAIPTVVPQSQTQDKVEWYLDIIVENTGGPIPRETLADLNSPDPTPVKMLNENKEGAMGIGVFLNRYLLHNEIGHGADLIYINLGGGWVQTRLRLPASLLEQETAFYSDPDKLIVDDYLLYVEDDPDIYRESRLAISDQLDQYDGVTLEHARSYSSAINMVREKLPQAIFTDMKIYNDEQASRGAAQQYGEALIKQAMQHAHGKDQRPPIWIISAEYESHLRDRLEEHISTYGYQFVSAKDATPERLASQGTLSIFSDQKHPDKIEQFEKFLEHVIKKDSSNKRHQERPSFAPDPTLQTPCVTVGLRDEKFEEIEDIYHAALTDEQKTVIIVQERCTSVKGLSNTLSKWFVHSGMSNPDPILFNADEKLRMFDHVHHKNLLLFIQTNKKIKDSLPIQFQYWGWSRNLWFSSTKLSGETLAQKWIGIRMEDRGPLSQMRHDIKNEWRNPDLEVLLSEAIENINECERYLLPSNSLQEFIGELTSNGDRKTSLVLDNLLVETEGVIDNHLRFLSSVQSLYNKFTRVRENDSTMKPSIERHQTTLHILEEYLKGT